MRIQTYIDRATASRAAARRASDAIQAAIARQGDARIVAATGRSQLEFLDALTATAGIDWSRVEMFHLDEYVGLPRSHPASFRKYLIERLVAPTGIVRYHLLDGEGQAEDVADGVGRALAERPVDIAFVGIGENGHLAFNDPPADFVSDTPYLLVTLDLACRRQQVGEGWFASVDEVPQRAISMSVRQILKSYEIIALVPDARKADAVRSCVEGPVSPFVPASALQTHAHTTVYLDRDSAALLSPRARGPILQSDVA
jgi:glucosamine-6-phosphate deaminase